MSSLSILRQSAAEVLACAVLDLFPSALLMGGEGTKTGFYYKFFFEKKQNLDAQALILIEERMRYLIKQDLEVRTLEMMRQNAKDFFKHKKEPYRAEALDEIPDNVVQIFHMGEFFDLCHNATFVSSSKELGFIKLLNIYTTITPLPKNQELKVVTIEGTVYPTKNELKDFLKKADAAEKCDHRLIGQEMDLFSSNPNLCEGCWLWHPKGATLRELLLDFWQKEHRDQQFQLVSTPNMIKPDLLKKAGFYQSPEGKKEVFPTFELEGTEYLMSPDEDLLSPLIFNSKIRTHQELPIKYMECKESYNQEKSSQLFGLFQSRTYTQDYAQIFCSPEQVNQELISSLQFINKTIKMFGLEHRWVLITKGRKYLGTLERWEESQNQMAEALMSCGINYIIDKEVKAFYGPSIEVRYIDALGREWKGANVSINLTCPERLGLKVKGIDDRNDTPVMITRSMFGSLERFIGVLIEHHSGLLPLWLAPEQVRVVTLAEKHLNYAESIQRKLESLGFRVGLDRRIEHLGGKIHAAEREKIPFLIVIGEKEEQNGSITVRSCYENTLQNGLQLETFCELLRTLIRR